MKKTIILLSAVLFFASCAVQKNLTETKITQQQATGIIKQLAGTQKPERRLYHTYEGISQKHIWSKKGGGNSTVTYKETITLTKQEGNYVEGRINYDYGGSIGSYPVFGRYNFTHLYLFNSSPSAEWPPITEYRIDQNGRILFKTRHANRNTNGARPTTQSQMVAAVGFAVTQSAATSTGSNTTANSTNHLNWIEEPKAEVDLYPYDRKYDEYYTYTGYISKTDDYINDEAKPTQPVTQKETGTDTQKTTQVASLADKLKELKNLYDQGLISKEEYDAARKKALEK